MDELPKVDLERIEQIYKELRALEVRLDPNPIELGPRRFNGRIAQVRAMLTRVEQLFLQVSEDMHLFKRLINAKRGLYELEKRELLVGDPRCRVGRSQGEREALADVQLRSKIEEIQALESCVFDLETVMSSIKSRRTDLRDVQGRMRDQMKFIEHELSMGARWGNRMVTVANAQPEALSADVEQTLSWLGDAAVGESPSALPTLAASDEVEAFLADLDT